MWTKTAVARAAIAGGASRRFGSNSFESLSWAATTNTVSRATRTIAARAGRVRRAVKKRGTAHQAKLGARTTRTTQVATTSPSQSIRRTVGAAPSAGPSTYSRASTMLRAMIHGVLGEPGWRNRKRATEAPRSRKNAVCMTVARVRVSAFTGVPGAPGAPGARGGVRLTWLTAGSRVGVWLLHRAWSYAMAPTSQSVPVPGPHRPIG